jgi:hypothetical protein
MIDVQEVLKGIPHFETFCSVEKLHSLVEHLRADSRFDVKVAGTSVNGVPVYHVRCGTGSVKALLVAFPDCMEPIGGMTTFSLMTLLREGNSALLAAEVEWHIVPCIDPDGALMNEAWSQKSFALETFMRNYFVQARREQVDNSFPISHKKLMWDQPSKEAQVLKGLLDRIQPDFFFSLHNAWTGGAFYLLSRDIGRDAYRELYGLLESQRFPLQKRPIWKEICAQFSAGAVEMFSIRKYYDYLEQTNSSPEKVLTYGAGSWDYLAQIKPDALTFVTELGYVQHPSDESEKETGENLRRFKLRVDADSKYLGTVILEEWEKVKDDVDTSSPIYRAIVSGRVFPSRERLPEGAMPLSRYPTRDILFNPQYARTMTEGDRFNACMTDGGFFFLLFSYQFVRLLKASQQTPAVRQAVERLEHAFDDAVTELKRHVDFSSFKVFPCDTLVRVQLGSGLIALNSILDARRR